MRHVRGFGAVRTGCVQCVDHLGVLLVGDGQSAAEAQDLHPGQAHTYHESFVFLLESPASCSLKSSIVKGQVQPTIFINFLLAGRIVQTGHQRLQLRSATFCSRLRRQASGKTGLPNADFIDLVGFLDALPASVFGRNCNAFTA